MHVLLQTQEAYDEYCKLIRDSCSDDFWRMLESVYEERTGIIDRVLKTSRDVFVRDMGQFQPSVRLIRGNMVSVGGDFKSLLMHEITIDLRPFNLPVGDMDEIHFKFVNPLWAWVSAANVMVEAGAKMHFEAKHMFHETTNARLYGAGVSFGDKLKFAASRTPAGGKSALFGISFDGGDSGVSDRSIYPICVGVLNFDGADPAACFNVGYIPCIAKLRLLKKKGMAARAYIFQRCVGAILDVLENVSQDGFTARIGGIIMRLHPFLAAIRVDSKERKTYFGLKSDRSCAICRFRKGWSCFRRGTAHGKDHIRRLWNLAIDQPTTRRRDAFGRAQKRAREQLHRHGFNKKLRCTLLDHAKTILIRDPQLLRQSLFASVIFNDLLHWELNCCDYFFDAVTGVMTANMQQQCDENTRRLPRFCQRDGTGIARFKTVSSVTYLTTARRLTLMFVWVHALGTGARMLPEDCRRPALVALAAMQTIILACQGGRSYSEDEWTRLLIDSSYEFFSALQFLMQYKETHDTSDDPKVFVPERRYVHHMTYI